MTKVKVSHVALFIYKSNFAIAIGVASKNSVTYSFKHFPPSLEKSLHSSFFKKGRQLLDLIVMQGVASKDFYNCLGEEIPWV
jgi:hypothetical protein